MYFPECILSSCLTFWDRKVGTARNNLVPTGSRYALWVFHHCPLWQNWGSPCSFSDLLERPTLCLETVKMALFVLKHSYGRPPERSCKLLISSKMRKRCIHSIWISYYSNEVTGVTLPFKKPYIILTGGLKAPKPYIKVFEQPEKAWVMAVPDHQL